MYIKFKSRKSENMSENIEIPAKNNSTVDGAFNNDDELVRTVNNPDEMHTLAGSDGEFLESENGVGSQAIEESDDANNDLPFIQVVNKGGRVVLKRDGFSYYFDSPSRV